jgi:hypothetical protein
VTNGAAAVPIGAARRGRPGEEERDWERRERGGNRDERGEAGER